MERSREDKIRLIDSNVISLPREGDDIIRKLYYGNIGLDMVEVSDFAQEIDRANNIREAIDYLQIITIDEVIKELSHKIDLLNKNHRFLNRSIRRKNEENDEREIKVEMLREYSNIIHNILSKLKGTDPRRHFTEQEKRSYGHIFRIVEQRSRDIVKRHLEIKAQMYSPRRIGYELQTDQHLLSTALTLGLERKVEIYTRDRGIYVIKERLDEQMQREIIFRKKSNLTITGEIELPIPLESAE